MAAKPLQLVNNLPTEVEATVVSAGAGDAGELVALDSAGKLDLSVLPTGVGPATKSIITSENLVAGDYINVYNVSGTATVRKADATTASAGKQAHGFVLNNVTSPAPATVYFEGANTALTGLTPGLTYVLSHTTPGGVVALSAGTTTAGQILQVVGVATAVTEIDTEIGTPVVRG